MSILFIIKKSIPSTTSSLLLVNKKFFSIIFILHEKDKNNPFIGLQNSTIDFLSFKICFSYFAT